MLIAPIYSVVIPVYCEGYHLKTVLATVQRTLEFLKESYELIIVDDGSSDNTWAVLQELSEKYPMLRALRLTRNFGKESALCAGLEMARGRAIIIMDGDLQHPPQLIPEMVRIWRESDTDVVEAIKSRRGREALTSKIGSRIFFTIFNKLCGYNLNDATDYKLMDRQVVDVWLNMRERALFFRGMIAWLGFKCVQIPFAVPERIAGQSRWSIFRLTKLGINSVTAFSSLPLQFITFSGVGFLLFAIVLGGYALLKKFAGNAVTGFTTVILLLLIIGSALMIGLGIIGQYIARIYEEVKGRPRYVVAESIGKQSDKIDYD